MDSHPTPTELFGFLSLQGRPRSREDNSRMVRHLLGRCPECLNSLRGLGGTLEPGLTTRQPDLSERSAPPRAESYDYAAAFDRAERALSSFLTLPGSPAKAAQALLDEIEGEPSEDQASRVVSEIGLQWSDFVEHLVRVAHSLRFKDPSRMLHYAELAKVAAESSSEPLAGGQELLADQRARAWSEYGNALRVCGRHQEADPALERAESWRSRGTGDPLLRATLLEQLASLRIAQRRFDEAIQKADEAAAIYRELEKPSLLASTMVQRAIATLYGGEPYGAAALLNRAIPLIDTEDDPHLLLSALHNLVRCYIDLGRPEQALELFREAREIYQGFLDPIHMLRAGWHEAQILRDLGRLEEAEAVFLRVREEFLERDLSHDAALVSLDLAEVYVRQKDFAALKESIAAAVPVFHAIGAEREILASWLQLLEVAHEEQAALQAVRDLGRRLEAASMKSLSPH